MNIRPSQFPLNSEQPTNNTVAGLTQRYKNMLGSEAAGQDVGLFYQLNRNAKESEKALNGTNEALKQENPYMLDSNQGYV